MSEQKELAIIGRAEEIDFVDLDYLSVPARVDTGAKTATIWASAKLENGELIVVFFGQGSEFYSGKEVKFKEYDQIVVKNSTGEEQTRYRVKLLVRFKGRKIRARFTLADRSSQVYPVLIGRNVLRGKFIVDVKKGINLTALKKANTDNRDSKVTPKRSYK